MKLPKCSDVNAPKPIAGSRVWCVYEGEPSAKITQQWTNIVEVSYTGEQALVILDDKPIWLHKSYFWHEKRIAMLEASQVEQRQ